MNNSKNYTVWVGGTEVNDYYLNLNQATTLKKYYEDMGYTDVKVEEIANEK